MKSKQIVQQIISEMALTLKPHRTGVPLDLLLSERTYASSRHHRPRLKAFSLEKGVSSSVSIDAPVTILAGDAIKGKAWRKLVNYIEVNRVPLMALWNEEIDHVDYVQRHQKV